MKKVILAAALVVTLASCGNSKTEATADSTATTVDTTAVTATDSTVAEIPADTTEVK